MWYIYLFKPLRPLSHAATALLQATTAAILSFSSTFPISNLNNPLQIIQYKGPKETSRHKPLKGLLSKNTQKLNTKLESKGDLAPTSDGAKLINLTSSGR